MPVAVEPHAEVAGADHLGSEATDGGADPGIAARPAEARAGLLPESGLAILAVAVWAFAVLLGHAPEGGPRGAGSPGKRRGPVPARSEEHTSALQSLMRISYAVF